MLGYIKHSRTGEEIIFVYEGDDVRLIQKEKLRANMRKIEEMQNGKNSMKKSSIKKN